MKITNWVNNLIHKRESDPTNTKQVQVRYVGQNNKYGAVTNLDTAMKVSAFYRAINILSDSVSCKQLQYLRKDKQGYWNEETNSNLSYLLTHRPNDRFTIFTLINNAVLQVMLYGNAYIYIVRKGTEIDSLILLSPNSVYYNIYNDSYKVTDAINKIDGLFNSSQLIHLKNKSVDGGYLGVSLVEYVSNTLGLAKAADSEAFSILSNGGKLKGLVSTESSVIGFGAAQDNQLEDISGNIQDELNSGKDILTMPQGTTFTPLSMTTKDLSLIESRELSIFDIARSCGVPPSFLGASSGGNYKAAENEIIIFEKNTLIPLMKQIEDEFSAKLITKSVSSKYKIYFDRSSLTTYKDDIAAFEKGVQIGIYTPAELRKIFNLPYKDNIDKVFISCNLQSIEEPTVQVKTKVLEEKSDSKTDKKNIITEDKTKE